jgi:hypothetical protein
MEKHREASMAESDVRKLLSITHSRRGVRLRIKEFRDASASDIPQNWSLVMALKKIKTFFITMMLFSAIIAA